MAGNLHFAPGKSYQNGPYHVHDLSPFQATAFDFSHTIHGLSFGKKYPVRWTLLEGGKGGARDWT